MVNWSIIQRYGFAYQHVVQSVLVLGAGQSGNGTGISSEYLGFPESMSRYWLEYLRSIAKPIFLILLMFVIPASWEIEFGYSRLWSAVTHFITHIFLCLSLFINRRIVQSEFCVQVVIAYRQQEMYLKIIAEYIHDRCLCMAYYSTLVYEYRVT